MLFNVRVRAAEIVCMGIVRVHIKCSHITVIDVTKRSMTGHFMTATYDYCLPFRLESTRIFRKSNRIKLDMIKGSLHYRIQKNGGKKSSDVEMPSAMSERWPP